MDYKLSDEKAIAGLQTDCLLVAVFSDQTLSAAAKVIDQASNGQITERLALGDFVGQSEQVEMLYQLSNVAAKRVMLVGMGSKDAFSADQFKKIIRAVSKRLLDLNITGAISCLSEILDQKVTLQQCVLVLSEETYRYSRFKSKQESEPSLKTMTFVVDDIPSCIEFLNQAVSIANGMAFAKDLANAPGNLCTPTHLAEQAEVLANIYDTLELEVLDEAEMEQLGMGAFLSVSKGSTEPGKMIVLQYQGAKATQAPIALVGKGVTFDTGGISLKPGAAMDEMKYDMSGAASVLGALKACCELQLPLNVIAVVAAAENMPSGVATKPGDIVTSMSGQTIEVLNTDAEGRLVLCDALTYVSRYNPSTVIDVATLTGACIIALGHHISGLMVNDEALADDILQAGKVIKDEAWQLPMTDDYQQQLKSNFADLPNIGSSRAAGTITAACFLSNFTKKYSWAHLDIAGTAWVSGAKKGATGRPVPLLAQFLINRSTVA